MIDFIVGLIFIIVLYKIVKTIWNERRIVNIFKKKDNTDNHQ